MLGSFGCGACLASPSHIVVRFPSQHACGKIPHTLLTRGEHPMSTVRPGLHADFWRPPRCRCAASSPFPSFEAHFSQSSPAPPLMCPPSHSPGFEGGQMPLYRRLPKYVGRPMGPGHHKTNYGLIKLSVLNKCDANSEVTYESCLAAGHMTKVLPAPCVIALDPAALALAPPHAAALLANRPCPAFSHTCCTWAPVSSVVCGS